MPCRGLVSGQIETSLRIWEATGEVRKHVWAMVSQSATMVANLMRTCLVLCGPRVAV
jgi:hypothetical protein